MHPLDHVRNSGGGVDGEDVASYVFATPGGHRIEMSDDEQSLRVTDAAGSSLELSPGKVRLKAATDLVLEAPGKTVTIRGQKVRFDRA